MAKSTNQVIELRCLLSIVVPVYRSAEILPLLIKQIHEAMKEIGCDKNFELVLICDGSPDNSWQVIQFLSDSHKFIKGILLRRNFGQHNAVMAGLRKCNGDVVVIMDDDLQHSPRYISKFLTVINEGADVCYSRFNRMEQKKWKIIGSIFNGFMANLLLDKPRNLYLSPFKAISKDICNLIIAYDGPYPYIDGLILLYTDCIKVIDVEHNSRALGVGNYDFWRSLALWAMMATGFSVKPLRLVILFGIIISVLAFFLIIGIMLFKFFLGVNVEGWTSLFVIIMFLGGLQLLGLGVIGEYLGRSYLQINGKPQAVIKDTTENLK